MPSNNEVSPLEAMGGEQVLDQLVDRFYTYIKEHDDVRHLFPDDLTQTAYKQKYFFNPVFGGRRCIQKNLVTLD